MSAQINSRICANFVSRAEYQGYKGKKRNDAGMDFIAGAVAALEAMGHDSEAKHLLMVASMIVAPRGYGEIERLAALEGSE